jgi:FKBP-type peptidyl-prolyl cis-trans isomerase
MVHDLVRIGHKDGPVVESYALRGSPLIFQIGAEMYFVGLHAFLHGAGEGETRIGIVPASLAFGEEGTRDENGRCVIPPNSDLYCACHVHVIRPPSNLWH